MIVSDLDGTLLNEDRVISPVTAAALQRAHDGGVMVVAATGRSRHSALDLLRPVKVVEWVLCSNGATRYHLSGERLVHHRLIPAAHAAAFLEQARRAYPELGLAWETTDQLAWDRRYQDHRAVVVPQSVPQEGRVADFPDGRDLVKILLTHPDMTPTAWLQALRELAGPAMSVSTSGTDFVEVTHHTATKGQAIATLCEEVGVLREDVVAFGDQVNDLDMLSWAGRGYAMANASEPVKAVATHHAPHHADDGVAAVIDELLDNPRR